MVGFSEMVKVQMLDKVSLLSFLQKLTLTNFDKL
jgi:hypothetical protein